MTPPPSTKSHMHSVDRPLCALGSTVETIDDMMQSIYGHVDCEACLRRAIGESEERARALRTMLSKVEEASS